MNQKYRISIKVKDVSTNIADDSVDLEIYLRDLLVNATLPALGMELLDIQVNKARKQDETLLRECLTLNDVTDESIRNRQEKKNVSTSYKRSTAESSMD